MAKTLTTLRKQVLRTFFLNSINRDIVILLIVSIVIGSALARGLAMTANSYFSETITSLVGEYGEFDFLVNVREEVKEEGRAQIEKVISQVFPGARLKEGPTITGLTSFMVGIPAEYKTKQTYETIDQVFGSVPGRSGISIMTEPRITLKAVPDGAKDLVIDQVMQIKGVLFAFRDGNSVTVLVQSLEQSSSVNAEIERVLGQYQLIDIAFPVGGEPDNPIRMGEQLADALRSDRAIGFAESVSADTKRNDMAYLVSTMIELKKFLTAYATKAVIRLPSGFTMRPGDVIAFQGASPNILATGAAVDLANVLVQVTAIKNDGTAEGMVIQGDASKLSESQGFLVSNSTIASPIGTANFRNPRSELGNALGETSKLVGQIPGFAQDAQSMIGIANTSFDNYNTSLGAVEQTLTSLSNAGATIQAATSGLAGLDTSAIQLQVGNSAQAMGSLVNTLQVVRLLKPDVASSINEMTAVQQNLINLQTRLRTLDSVAADARRARTAIDSIVANGNNTIASLRNFDIEEARQTLNATGGRLGQLQQFNTPLVAAQLQYLGTAVPNLSDEEISRSVNLMDQFIAGQVIPGQRLQILTKGNVATELAAPTIYRVVGNSNLSFYTSALGVIEPDPRAEVMTILTQVKAVLAGLVSLVATVVFLTLDHTAVMTVIRRQRNVIQKLPAKGWRRLIQGVTNVFAAFECLYGMGIGALLLTAMFVLSGGGIPYVPWFAVPVLGAALGLFIANNAEKINPVASEEVSAGEALGLSFDEIMREIVIPNARPGLLQKLNRRKVKFK
jgi:ABC-type amino acid transport system permease subunit